MPTEKNKDAPNSKSGRKPIITDALVVQIDNALMNGMSQKGVCDLAGISQSTYYQWIRVSDGLIKDGEHPEMPKPPRRRKGDTDEVFHLAQLEYAHQIKLLTQFSQTVKKALASVELSAVRAITEAFNPSDPKKESDWRASAWYLERVHWKEYGKRTIGTEDDGSINLNITVNKVKKDANQS